MKRYLKFFTYYLKWVEVIRVQSKFGVDYAFNKVENYLKIK